MSEFRVMDEMDEPTAVYEFRNLLGELLYVGISKTPAKRWKQHAESQPWWGDVREKNVIGWFSTRRRAETVEKALIQEEHPMHNKVHSGRAFGSSGEYQSTWRIHPERNFIVTPLRRVHEDSVEAHWALANFMASHHVATIGTVEEGDEFAVRMLHAMQEAAALVEGWDEQSNALRRVRAKLRRALGLPDPGLHFEPLSEWKPSWDEKYDPDRLGAMASRLEPGMTQSIEQANIDADAVTITISRATAEGWVTEAYDTTDRKAVLVALACRAALEGER